MLKGYRGPALALVMSVVLLGIVIVTRPADTSSPEPSVTPASSSTAALPTWTPAPTIPLNQIDTSILHEAVVGCFKKLNPLLAGYNQPDRDVSSLIFEGLMKTDNYGADVPDLAASQPQVSSDGLTYLVTLRDDVQWQDGVPLKSSDVIFTINLMQDTAFPGPTDLHTFWQTVEVDALDDHLVRFHLAQPLAAFPDYLRIGILPEHVLKGMPAADLLTHPFNLSPIGTGPYQLDHFVGNGSQLTGVRLRFAATYSQRPEGKDGFAFREIQFDCMPTAADAVAAFQRGDVNSVAELPPDMINQASGLSQLALYNANRPSFGAVIYNWKRDSVNYFRDLRMREALAHSVDRTKLINQYMANRATVADSPILPDSWAYAPDANCPTYDVNAAKAQLAQVQFVPPPSLNTAATQPATESALPTATPDYRFQLLVSNDVALSGLADGIVQSWEDIGVHATKVVVDAATFKERLVQGDFDSALVELNLAPGADPDPYSLWRQEPAAGGLNFGQMDEREISGIVEQARRESVNGANRAQLYHQFQQAFCSRAAALLLYYPVYTYAVDSRIQGIQLGFMSSPDDRFRTIKDWHFGG